MALLTIIKVAYFAVTAQWSVPLTPEQFSNGEIIKMIHYTFYSVIVTCKSYDFKFFSIPSPGSFLFLSKLLTKEMQLVMWLRNHKTPSSEDGKRLTVTKNRHWRVPHKMCHKGLLRKSLEYKQKCIYFICSCSSSTKHKCDNNVHRNMTMLEQAR